MAGILNQSPQAPQQAPQPPGQQPQAQPGQQANPGAEQTADMFLANGLNMIHDKKFADGFVGKIVNSDDPLTEIAKSTLLIVDRIEGSMKNSGKELPLEYLAQVANVLMGEIIQVAELSGLEPLSDEDKYGAYSLAVSMYIDSASKSGKIPPEELQKLSEQAQQTPEGQKIMEQMGQGGQPPGAPQGTPQMGPAPGNTQMSGGM